MKVTVVYSMKGCPFCVEMKEELDKKNIPFLERDIDEFEDEYEEFVKITGNDYVPALMLLTLDENDDAHNVKFLAPDRDYNDISEGIEMIESYLSE
jgi:glutaredoxin